MSNPNCYQNLGKPIKNILEILCKYSLSDLNIDDLIEKITNDVKIFTYIDIDDKIKEKDEGASCIIDIMKSLVDNYEDPLTYSHFEGMMEYIKRIINEKYLSLDYNSGRSCINYNLLKKDIERDDF